jgi:2-polyprenyl-3-methyl-5-hydroxy-6-metoxy-1,4-benzoquinol methylase
MPIGPIVRQKLGPLERPISEFYRGIFVNLDAFVDQIEHWTSGSNILELGCGEGAVVERLARKYPSAQITGIDISPMVGRLFEGDQSHVTFRHQTIRDFAIEYPASMDLLIVSDVMHHIPWELHEEILTDAGKVLRHGGYLVLKDWERRRNPIHALTYFLERYITGDRVRYKSAAEFRELLNKVFGENCVKAETRIRPWANNIAFLVSV